MFVFNKRKVSLEVESGWNIRDPNYYAGSGFESDHRFVQRIVLNRNNGIAKYIQYRTFLNLLLSYKSLNNFPSLSYTVYDFNSAYSTELKMTESKSTVPYSSSSQRSIAAPH